MKNGYYNMDWGVTIDLIGFARETKFAIITRIEVARDLRGNGFASQMMDQVLEDADEEGVMLALAVESDGTGLTYLQLRAWYERMGFEPINSVREEADNVMVRMPHGYSGEPLSQETFQQQLMRFEDN